MKKFYLIGVAALFALGACQDSDENVVNPGVNGEVKNVKFELDASSLAHEAAVRAYTPTYTKNGFNIYAFKRNPGTEDYVFNKKVDLSNMTYNGTTNRWEASDNLEIGTYKFVHTYGAPQTNLTLPAWTANTTPLVDGNDLRLNFNANGTINEAFLETDKTLATLVPYTLGMESANQTVSGTLKRAVSRIDLMFIPATKNDDGTFTEEAYSGTGGNILGGKVIKEIEFGLTNINNQISLFGVNTGSNVSADLVTKNPGATNDAWNYITIGNGTATAVGATDYKTYDNIAKADIITGGAHIFGTYLLPTTGRVTGLELKIVPTVGETRTISIPNNLPLERNKVTLVKVYVLNKNNVFSTTVDFEVEIITAWEDANEVTGSIS